MRRRRDVFARIDYEPRALATPPRDGCAWDGQPARPRHPLFVVWGVPDAGRPYVLAGGAVCSWSCLESLQGAPIARGGRS